MVYNGLQTSLRKRFSDRYSWDVNYTYGKSTATQGGDLSAYYIASASASFDNNQDFFDPEADRGPASNDLHHRLNVSFIYETPSLNGGQGMTNGFLGNWQISGIVQVRSGEPLRVTQPSGMDRSRPDVVDGQDLVLGEMECIATGCTYLNRAAYVAVPVYSATNAPVRPGNYLVGMARGPNRVDNNFTFSKSFGVGGGRRLQARADIFNAFNVKNYNNPQAAINNVDFTRITGAATARVFQLGARFTF